MTEARAVVRRVFAVLEQAPRLSCGRPRDPRFDVPEGVRYIALSDTLATELAAQLRSADVELAAREGVDGLARPGAGD